MENLNDAKLWFAALIGALTGLWGWMDKLVEVGKLTKEQVEEITGEVEV